MNTKRTLWPTAALLAAALLLTLAPAAPAAAAGPDGWAGVGDLFARWSLSFDNVFAASGAIRDPIGEPLPGTGANRDPSGGPLPGVGGWADPDGLTAAPADNEAGSDQDPNGGGPKGS
ncbi:MAG TPA: hypothetical protein VKU40_14455 [Thermoanaerobaculia bacterium]|nr:hypothetical protein [Thermoanaerobaculia bacterium]